MNLVAVSYLGLWQKSDTLRTLSSGSSFTIFELWTSGYYADSPPFRHSCASVSIFRNALRPLETGYPKNSSFSETNHLSGPVCQKGDISVPPTCHSRSLLCGYTTTSQPSVFLIGELPVLSKGRDSIMSLLTFLHACASCWLEGRGSRMRASAILSRCL